MLQTKTALFTILSPSRHLTQICVSQKNALGQHANNGREDGEPFPDDRLIPTHHALGIEHEQGEKDVIELTLSCSFDT